MTQPTGVSVLVVDDDADVCKAVCMMVGDVGYACQQATNGAEALKVLRAATTGMVVVLDLMMPVLTGWGVLQAVEADPQLAGRHAFVILTATYRPMLMSEQSLISRVHALIVHKPFDIDHLLNAVWYEAARLGGRSAEHDAC